MVPYAVRQQHEKHRGEHHENQAEVDCEPLHITDPTTVGHDLAGYFTPEEWAEAAHDDISLEEVRRALSTISGSLSDAVIALRQER